ncbi:amidase [Pseudoroseomonas cervicalis]|uniref:amidase n=1 Tax=Teichococcus cervicalis TaxID=204525 RepID=UPI00278276B6|nr:amidase [Pseudoroseomonas cervicalis]MDQ1081676.1 amidase [Pseudoroseomonas cervicalis]
MTALHEMELLELTAKIRAREISPVEATRAQLDRIRALDGALHSYALVLEAPAMDAARQAEAEIARGEWRGPLHGAPIAVKDLCWTEGVPTAAGTTIHRDFRPAEDATVVARLRAAGAIILGKLQMTEGAYSAHHPSIPAPLNPWGPAHWTGASSSGSGAATAAGLCYGALGSDTGGSIRFPCAANGLTGMKGSWGRVSRHGVFDLGASLDHIGPMTRSAADAAAMLGAIAGEDAKDPTAASLPVPDYLAGIGEGIAGLRIGLDPAWNAEGCDADTLAVVEAAANTLAALGAQLTEVRFPDPSQVIRDWFPLCAVEVAAAHAATWPARRDEYGPILSALIEQGHGVSALDLHAIDMRRRGFTARVNALFADIDLLLVPVQAFAAPTLARMGDLGADEALMKGLLQYTCPFDMTGHPALTLPGGVTAQGGMPVGFQLIGPHWSEAMLFRAGHAYQSVTGWHRRHPAMDALAVPA